MASDKRPPLTMVCTECKAQNYVTTKIRLMCLTEWNLKNIVPNVESIFCTEKKGRNISISLYS